MRSRQLDLDDVRASQRRHVRRIGTDIERQFAGLGNVAAARVRPDDRSDADRLGFGRKFADFLNQVENPVRTRVDGEANRRATEPQRIIDRAGDGLVDARRPAVRAVGLEDCRDLPGKGIGARFDHAERCRIGRQAGIDGELIMIMRIIGRRVGRKAARRAMFETLVDRQDDQLAGAAQPTLHQDAGKIGLGPGIVRFIIGEDRFHGRSHGHPSDSVSVTWRSVSVAGSAVRQPEQTIRKWFRRFRSLRARSSWPAYWQPHRS